ncbi:copper resistance protein NlpE N-terminal domain-containing protein [Luteimonas sp. MJ246]|uniref:copper resistance protein NlpE N-terminal domain-containing protein n=1 Tax=Luteimonas sp. MJ174 TaxID=3129237 RepID=UPI0031BA9C56
MPRAHASVLALLLVALSAGCTRGDHAAGNAGLPGLDAGQDVVEWRGSLPCADCEAIDTRLVLERRGGEQVYELVEVYVALDGSVSFEETGEWRIDQSTLSLEPRTGGLRRYALVHGGVLQVRDLRGRVFPGREHDLLLPAGRQP